MNIECETPLYQICPDGIEFELVLRHGEESMRASGFVTCIFRAFDGRIGIDFDCEDSGPLHGDNLIPLEYIEGYRVLEDDWEIAREGGRAAFEDIYADEIEELLGDSYLDSSGGFTTWDELVFEERLSRLSPQNREWHRNDELVIYLTIAASTAGEAEIDLATRVGGALWAAVRQSNPERVKLARELAGLKVDDARYIAAAAATDPHAVARVASSAMFVGLGGEKGTSETMRLLTLLQIHSQVPRFF